MKTPRAQQKLIDDMNDRDNNKSELTLLLERVHDLAPITMGLSVGTMVIFAFMTLVVKYRFSPAAVCVFALVSVTFALVGAALNFIQADSLYRRDGVKWGTAILVASGNFLFFVLLSL